MEVYVGLSLEERVVYRNIERVVKEHPDDPYVDTEGLRLDRVSYWPVQTFRDALEGLIKKGILIKKEVEWRMGIAEEYGHQYLVITKDGVPDRTFDLNDDGTLRLVRHFGHLGDKMFGYPIYKTKE